MRVTIGTLMAAKDALNKLFSCDKLPALIAFRLSKFFRQINEIYDNFEQVRVKKVIEYGGRQRNGHYKVARENEVKFQADMRELLLEEVELEIPKLSLEDLSSAHLTPADLGRLWFMLEG